MGEEFKREADDGDNSETVEQLNEFGETLNSFADKIAKATADARTAIEKKNELEDADSSKKKSSSSSESDGGDDSVNIDIDDVTSAIDKMIALKGDMKLSEAKEFISENEEMVEEFI